MAFWVKNQKKRGAVAESWVLSLFFFFVFLFSFNFFGKPTEVNHREGRLLRRIFFFKELTT